jgi:hypothetical protein
VGGGDGGSEACGREASIWDLGGIRWKAAGAPRRRLNCSACARHLASAAPVAATAELKQLIACYFQVAKLANGVESGLISCYGCYAEDYDHA